MRQKTIKQLLSQATTKLDRLDAEILLAFVLKKDRIFLFTHENDPVTFFSKLKFSSLVKKRLNHVPVAQILQKKEFYGIPFLVNKHTLIPRPETEEMIEIIFKKFKEIHEKKIFFLDVGTGSGCIPIAVSKTLFNEADALKKSLQFFASDISKKALALAEKNSKIQQTPITFFHGDLLDPFAKHIKQNDITLESSFLFVTANLPYLTDEQFHSEESIQKEPKSALVADDSGLAFYKKLLFQIHTFVNSKPCRVWCIMEINPEQAKPLEIFTSSLFPNARIKIHKDLSSNERFLSLSL